jgi:hypothetical protein
MIGWLIKIGRGLVVFCAILTIVICAAKGCFYGDVINQMIAGGDNYSVQAGTITIGVVIGGLLGGVVGIIVAGSLFGLMAAVFDMQLSLRRLADGVPNTSASVTGTTRREPFAPGFARPAAVAVDSPRAPRTERDPTG